MNTVHVEQYDIIGDVHGHATELRQLLAELNYDDSFIHPQGHCVIFLGDFIDRGTKNEEVLTIVRSMIEQGSALAVMGNHEYNALAYHTHDYERKVWLREHNQAHYEQHETFLSEFDNRPDDLREVLQWMITLPLYIEIPNKLRAIHACWDQQRIDAIEPLIASGVLKRYHDQSHNAAGATMTMKFLFASTEKDSSGVQKGSIEYELVESLLKGTEAALFLPTGEPTYFIDKGGKRRYNTRLRWFGSATDSIRKQTLSIPDEPTGLAKLEAEEATFEMNSVTFYDSVIPVFFGHYWMTKESIDDAISHNAACVDYSIAKDGHLACYSFRPSEYDGSLNKSHYRMVQSRT